MSSWDLGVEWPRGRGTKVYDLAHALAPGIPHGPVHPPFSFSMTKLHGDIVYKGGTSMVAEMFTTGGHVGTHIDAAAHISRDGKVSGGREVIGHQSYGGGVEVGSILEVRPFLGPGFLVDMPTLLGRDLTASDVIGGAELERWFAAHGPLVPGAAILIRTGWAKRWPTASYISWSQSAAMGAPGVDLSGAEWLSSHGARLTGSDTMSYEQPNPANPVHVHLLLDEDIPIMESLNLEALAADQRWSFFFVGAPIKIAGATGAPLRPLAIV